MTQEQELITSLLQSEVFLKILGDMERYESGVLKTAAMNAVRSQNFHEAVRSQAKSEIWGNSEFRAAFKRYLERLKHNRVITSSGGE